MPFPGAWPFPTRLGGGGGKDSNHAGFFIDTFSGLLLLVHFELDTFWTPDPPKYLENGTGPVFP